MNKIFQACTKVLHEKFRDVIRNDPNLDLLPVKSMTKNYNQKISRNNQNHVKSTPDIIFGANKAKERPLSRYIDKRKKKLEK